MITLFFWFSATFHLSEVFLDHLHMLAVMVFDIPRTGTLPGICMRIDTPDFPGMGLRRHDILIGLIAQ